MRITVNDDGDLVMPGDSIPGFSAQPGDQFELAPDSDGSALILTRVTDKDSVYGILGTGTSTDALIDELRPESVGKPAGDVRKGVGRLVLRGEQAQ